MMMPRPLPFPGPKPSLPSIPRCPGHGHGIPGGGIKPWPPVAPVPPGLTDRFLDAKAFRSLDTDGDGVLSRNEFRDSRTHVGRFDKYDADKDGNIDAKEYSVGRHWERMSAQITVWGHKAAELTKDAGKAIGKAFPKATEG